MGILADVLRVARIIIRLCRPRTCSSRHRPRVVHCPCALCRPHTARPPCAPRPFSRSSQTFFFFFLKLDDSGAPLLPSVANFFFYSLLLSCEYELLPAHSLATLLAPGHEAKNF